LYLLITNILKTKEYFLCVYRCWTSHEKNFMYC